MVFEPEFGEMLHDALDLGVDLLGAGAGAYFGLGELEGDELGFIFVFHLGWGWGDLFWQLYTCVTQYFYVSLE